MIIYYYRHLLLYVYYQKFKFENGDSIEIRLELQLMPHGACFALHF